MLELEGAAGCENVNCRELDGPVLLPVVSGLLLAEIEGVAAGCEKLKPSGPDLAPVKREKPVVVLLLLATVLALVWDSLQGELDIEVF